MPLIDIFSRRTRQANKSGADVYKYDDIQDLIRVQACQITREVLGTYVDNGILKGVGNSLYVEIRDVMRKEIGEFILPPSKYIHTPPDKEFFDWFLQEERLSFVIDGLELCFRVMQIAAEDSAFKGNELVHGDQGIQELNDRLKEAQVGYQYGGGMIMRVDSQVLHADVVVPALNLLTAAKFASAEKEFLAAHVAYRARDYETCLVECNKAFESVLKIIGGERGWGLGPTDTAKKMLDAAYASGFIEPVLQSEFTALRSLLEGAVPTMRNKLGGHGAGAVTRNVPAHFASLQLHQTAALILFLAQHHAANP